MAFVPGRPPDRCPAAGQDAWPSRSPPYLTGTYLGIDLVPDLVAHATAGGPCGPDWRFEVIDTSRSPRPTAPPTWSAFFFVMTHLLPEQTFWYLEEAKRGAEAGRSGSFFSFSGVPRANKAQCRSLGHPAHRQARAPAPR
jgi:hypothetical protein